MSNRGDWTFVSRAMATLWSKIGQIWATEEMLSERYLGQNFEISKMPHLALIYVKNVLF